MAKIEFGLTQRHKPNYFSGGRPIETTTADVKAEGDYVTTLYVERSRMRVPLLTRGKFKITSVPMGGGNTDVLVQEVKLRSPLEGIEIGKDLIERDLRKRSESSPV